MFGPKEYGLSNWRKNRKDVTPSTSRRGVGASRGHHLEGIDKNVPARS